MIIEGSDFNLISTSVVRELSLPICIYYLRGRIGPLIHYMFDLVLLTDKQTPFGRGMGFILTLKSLCCDLRTLGWENFVFLLFNHESDCRALPGGLECSEQAWAGWCSLSLVRR